MIPSVYTGLNCPICSVFHTLTQETVGQICFLFPFVVVYKLLHMSSTPLPYFFLCFLGVTIIFLCNLQITNSNNGIYLSSRNIASVCDIPSKPQEHFTQTRTSLKECIFHIIQLPLLHCAKLKAVPFGSFFEHVCFCFTNDDKFF